MTTASPIPDDGLKERPGSQAKPAAPPATSVKAPGSLPTVRPRRWVVGTVFIAVLAMLVLGAHGLLLRKAVSLDADKAAWNSGLEQRASELRRLDDQTGAARGAAGRPAGAGKSTKWPPGRPLCV